MDVDLRPLQHALRELRFTTPLEEKDPRYVQRPDELRHKLLNRILAPSERVLLLGGPAGYGKSTELLRLQQDASEHYAVCLCPCDRDLDLYRLNRATLYQYVLWRILYAYTLTPALMFPSPLTREITREVLAVLELKDVKLQNPGLFFASRNLREDHELLKRTQEVLIRLLSEIQRGFKPVLLIFDGFEKAPQEIFSTVIEDFIRSPVLAGCQSVFVLPQWTLYGWSSAQRWIDVEVFLIPVAEDSGFVSDVVSERAGNVIELFALYRIRALSGGLVRDGLQLATSACRAALDARSPRVEPTHVDAAKLEMQRSYQLLFSDDMDGARGFLRAVRDTHHLPANPALRDRMLSVNAVIPTADGSFDIHPVLAEWLG